MDDAYAAGLFDGEGYVRIATHHTKNGYPVYQVYAGLGVTYLPAVVALRAAYGGSINQNRHDLRGERNRIQFTWNVSSQKAAAFFRRIEMHLIIKREQVSLALEFQDHVDKHRELKGNRWLISSQRDEINAYRRELAKRISELKKVSFPPLVRNGPKVSEQSLTR